MEFPYFGGTNPRSWLLKFDQLFSVNSVPDDCRVMLVKPYLKGKAEFWFEAVELRIEQTSWDTFAELIIDEFGSYFDRFCGHEYKVTGCLEVSEIWEAMDEFDQSEASKTGEEEQTDELDEMKMAEGDSEPERLIILATESLALLEDEAKSETLGAEGVWIQQDLMMLSVTAPTGNTILTSPAVLKNDCVNYIDGYLDDHDVSVDSYVNPVDRGIKSYLGDGFGDSGNFGMLRDGDEFEYVRKSIHGIRNEHESWAKWVTSFKGGTNISMLVPGNSSCVSVMPADQLLQVYSLDPLPNEGIVINVEEALDNNFEMNSFISSIVLDGVEHEPFFDVENFAVKCLIPRELDIIYPVIITEGFLERLSFSKKFIWPKSVLQFGIQNSLVDMVTSCKRGGKFLYGFSYLICENLCNYIIVNWVFLDGGTAPKLPSVIMRIVLESFEDLMIKWMVELKKYLSVKYFAFKHANNEDHLQLVCVINVSSNLMRNEDCCCFAEIWKNGWARNTKFLGNEDIISTDFDGVVHTWIFHWVPTKCVKHVLPTSKDLDGYFIGITEPLRYEVQVLIQQYVVIWSIPSIQIVGLAQLLLKIKVAHFLFKDYASYLELQLLIDTVGWSALIIADHLGSETNNWNEFLDQEILKHLKGLNWFSDKLKVWNGCWSNFVLAKEPTNPWDKFVTTFRGGTKILEINLLWSNGSETLVSLSKNIGMVLLHVVGIRSDLIDGVSRIAEDYFLSFGTEVQKRSNNMLVLTLKTMTSFLQLSKELKFLNWELIYGERFKDLLEFEKSESVIYFVAEYQRFFEERIFYVVYFITKVIRLLLYATILASESEHMTDCMSTKMLLCDFKFSAQMLLNVGCGGHFGYEDASANLKGDAEIGSQDEFLPTSFLVSGSKCFRSLGTFMSDGELKEQLKESLKNYTQPKVLKSWDKVIKLPNSWIELFTSFKGGTADVVISLPVIVGNSQVDDLLSLVNVSSLWLIWETSVIIQLQVLRKLADGMVISSFYYCVVSLLTVLQSTFMYDIGELKKRSKTDNEAKPVKWELKLLSLVRDSWWGIFCFDQFLVGANKLHKPWVEVISRFKGGTMNFMNAG